MTNRIYNILKSLSFRAKNPTRAGANHAAKTAVNPHNPTQSPRINERRNERGNVFFTLFGAVAIVGVLGAGIMSTMRGPLSTMVEVNRREQAKAELRLASSLLLVNSGDTCSDSDGYTEGPDPTGSGPTGGGVLPSVGAPQNDPWGNPYGYCAWDHGNSAGTSGGCGSNILAGNTSTNNIAIAVMSAGPDGIFQTTCEDDNTGTNDYVEPDAGAEDDIVVAITYNQAISGSGGLWSIKDSEPGTAEIDKDVDLTRATGDFSGASPQLRLGAASMLLPDQSALATCNASNDQLLRRDTSTGRTLIQVCDDTGGNGWVNLTSPWSINGDDIYMASTATQLGIGTATPNDTLDVVGTFGLTGAAALGGTLDVTGATTLTTLTTSGLATLESLTVTNAATFNGSVTFSQPLVGDVTITGSNADNSSDALTVQNSASSVIMVAQNDGTVGIGKSDPTEKLDVDGNITASGTIMLDGTTILDNENDTSNILLGNTASNNPGTTTDYMNLGDAIHADLANKRVGIGFADSYDVSNFDSTLEVNGGADFTGGIDVDGASDIDTLTISGTGTALTVNNAADIDTLNVTGSGDALTVTNGVDIGGDVDVDGSLEADDYTYQGTTFIPTSCASNEKLDFESGAWVCESYDDEDGSGAAGDRNLQEVLADGNDANNQSMINISGIAVGSSTLSGSLVVDVTGNVGATNYCDNAGNNCFAPNDVGDLGTTIGNLAIDDLTDGATNATYGNLFLGHEGGSFGANNTYNTAVGYNALNSLDNDATLGAGDSNTAFGYNALSSNTTGSGNTAFGTNALFYNATGSNNVVMGEDAALGADSSTVINNSVILGHTAGSAITTADNNILIGYQAGDVITEGDNNIIIGYDVDPSSATASNELNIGNTIFGDLSTGYVGIGTNAPANTFHVESSSDYAAQIVGNNASWLTIRRPGFADNIGLLLGVDSSNKTIVGSNNATPLYFLTNSLTRIAIEATSGRVGIGTSSPEATLDVVGTDAMILPRGTTAQQPAGGVSVNGMIRYDTDVDKFQAFQAGAWQDILTSATSGGSSVSLVDVDNDTKIEVDTAFDGSANTTVFTNNSAETMRITATGELGIGTDTPDTLLHAESDSSSADSVTSVLRLTSTNDGTGTIAAGIGAGMEFEIETATDNFELGAVIEAVTTDVTDTSEDVDLVFKTMAAGATADEAMRIKNTGSVEVTSPTNAFLDLINDNNNNATTNYSAFRVINNGPFGTGTAKAFFGYDESNDVVKISRGAIGYNDFVIDSTGDVGIGTSTISDGSGSGGQALKLDVEGPIGGTYYCDEDG
ncbi:MAG: beta strand repeat-containing protein, partial [Bdellovibrionales bacterium]